MKASANALVAFSLLCIAAIAHSQEAAVEANRDSLIVAWEAQIAALPDTEAFERRGEDLYYLKDTSLPYDGELKLLGALVRPMEPYAAGAGISHTGFVEVKLTGLSPERLATQGYYFWLEPRQNLYFSSEEQQWLDNTGYQYAFESYVDPGTFGVLSLMLNYGVWIVLLAVVLWALIVLSRQGKKAKVLMDESSAINEKARANLDRSEQMQTEMAELAREGIALQKQSVALLQRLVDKRES